MSRRSGITKNNTPTLAKSLSPCRSLLFPFWNYPADSVTTSFYETIMKSLRQYSKHSHQVNNVRFELLGALATWALVQFFHSNVFSETYLGSFKIFMIKLMCVNGFSFHLFSIKSSIIGVWRFTIPAKTAITSPLLSTHQTHN